MRSVFERTRFRWRWSTPTAWRASGIESRSMCRRHARRGRDFLRSKKVVTNSRHLHSTRPSLTLGARSWQATLYGLLFLYKALGEANAPSKIEGRSYSMHYVYMARNHDNSLYVGMTINPEKRIATHNSKRGSQFTKRGNFKIVFLEKYLTLAAARKREIQIKKWRREKKERLITRYKAGLPT